jgi:hypothetical protein
MHNERIQIVSAGSPVLRNRGQGGFWQLRRGQQVLGWASSYAAALVKRAQLERASRSEAA